MRAGRLAQCDIRRHSAAGAGQWISISYVGGGAADGGMKVDGTQHARLKASPPHTCHLAHQTHVISAAGRQFFGHAVLLDVQSACP